LQPRPTAHRAATFATAAAMSVPFTELASQQLQCPQITQRSLIGVDLDLDLDLDLCGLQCIS